MTALDDLVNDMAALLDAPCTLEDRDFRLIAFSDQRGAAAVDTVRQRSILERGSTAEVRQWFLEHGVDRADGPTRTPGDPERGISGRLCLPAVHDGRTYGYFWLLDPDERIDPSLLTDATRIAASAAAMLSFAEQKQTANDDLYKSLIQRVAGGGLRQVRDSLAAAGLAHDKPMDCLLLSSATLPEQLAARTARAGVFWARYTDEVVAVLCRVGFLDPTGSAAAVLESLGLGRLANPRSEQVLVGVGPRARSVEDVPQAHGGAQVALRVAESPAGPDVVCWTDLGPLALLGVAPDQDLAWATIPDAVAAFVRDAPPDLVTTALTFLDEAGSVARTSSRLSVHRQTIYHRIAQIERMTGLSLDDGEDRLRLHLALRLARFLL
ncbi:MAG TPA: helix-turn-helix domain-containing protein [Marmoricola sp.]|nr:helix-turn-helix domain-containing protein [Marmoricola sp.]